MKFRMSYRKFIMVGMGIAFLSVLLFSACSKKKSEEEITITLKTEGALPSQPPAAVRQPLPARQETEHAAKTRSREEKPVRHVLETGQQPAQNKTANKTTRVAVNTPSVSQPQPSGPSPEDVTKQQILAVIDRQKQAMATKNVTLALEDIAGSHDQNKQALEDYFNRYDKIDVNFYNISVNVSGNTATALMNQRTSIVTKGIIPQTVTELTKVQWTFVDENNRWLITGTQILAKLKEK